jgi:hypothetical protein
MRTINNKLKGIFISYDEDKKSPKIRRDGFFLQFYGRTRD